MLSLALTTLALASILGQLTGATTFAQFCNDAACTDCGESVSVDNPGCLMEFGRVAVKFHGVNVDSVNLVSSPANTCNCQNDCVSDIVKALQAVPGCFPLTGPPAQSFRFVGNQGCDPNNC